MFSLVKRFLWTTKSDIEEKFDEEAKYLEDVIEKENEEEKKLLTTESEKAAFEAKANEKKLEADGEQSHCFKKSGIITGLKSNNGTIDGSYFFDYDSAKALFNELKIGSHIEYMAYQKPNTDFIKVVKIVQILDNQWDAKETDEIKIQKEINMLKDEKPTYFTTLERNFLGLVTDRQPHHFHIETERRVLTVELDKVEIDFLPAKGDRVYITARVQVDEDYVDQFGAILQVLKVQPTRLVKEDRCTVHSIHEEFGDLNGINGLVYYQNEQIPAGIKLSEGDLISADIIECSRGKYNWRCIKMKVLEANYMLKKSPPRTRNTRGEQKAVTVDEDKYFVFTSTFIEEKVEWNIVNNCERDLRVKYIEFQGKKIDSQLTLNDPPLGKSFNIERLSKFVLHFVINTKYFGESREIFKIQFENFQIKRSITINVCEHERDAEIARLRKENKEYTQQQNGRKYQQRARTYADQVWSKKCEVVPGVGLAPKRRFVANRIQIYEVPQRLRTAYLTAKTQKIMNHDINGMFPCLEAGLKFSNYARRFQTLLHLEEIEYFVNFRNYDRERAHFKREGEYLALVIEDLAERRPSLVVGDTVRATNPWTNSESEKRSYDGVIHKVLCNRICLKFNPGFQSKYNGEDYRLEFYFSRFGFRKQHYAVNHVAKSMGEHFLFPSKINLRENSQMDVELNENNDLVLKNDQILKWFNPTLNIVQKQAIRNILRGEVQNMPYIIFGPPGTGKTMTLVEIILQLMHNLQSARLIVGTPSNSAADLICTRLIESKSVKPGDFMRLVSQNQVEKDMIPAHLMPYCGTIDIAADGTCNDTMITTETGLKLRCQFKFLGRHRITIGTCATIGNYIQLGFPESHFTHVLIDESGQCSEPEVMTPLSLISEKRSQVILVGDPHQLPAICINKYAGDLGLHTSFLERILARGPYCKDLLRFPKTCGYNPRLVTKLLYNYRALPSILNIYNTLFYDSELLPMISETDSKEAIKIRQLDVINGMFKSKIRSKTHGAFFFGLNGENKQESDSPSWFNPMEAKNVFLTTIQLYRSGIEPEDIGIVTPYLKQVKHIRNMFISADVAMPKIGSVEEFQGQERDVIIISTVRSSDSHLPSDLKYSLGFVKCPRRMNVAISRARYLLLVIGNPNVLALDVGWRYFIQYCVDHNSYLGCDLPQCMNVDDDENNSNDERSNGFE